MSALANHLWQSTAFAVLAWLLTVALRKNSARLRHGVWMTASLKFLLPISLLVALGGQMRWRPATEPMPAELTIAVGDVSQPFSAPDAPSMWLAVARPAGSVLPPALAIIWAFGFLAISGSWIVRWLRIRAAVRAGSSLRLGLPVAAITCPTMLEPGVFGIFRPVLLLPEGIFERLSPSQMEAVIAHELCHVRNRDNLSAATQMFIETVFWFHPLVWWMGRQMVTERERASDEEVLRLGGAPSVYAHAILSVCRMYAETPLSCVSGITGADLKQRIEEIMANRRALGLSAGRKVLLAGVGALALGVTVAIWLVDVAHAQTQSQTPTFEVASVKLHVGGTDRNTLVPPTVLPGGRFVSKFPLKFLVSWAYKVPYQGPAGLTGLPDWADGPDSMFDVEATSAMPPGLSVQAREDRVRAMVQALLADRFKLVMRRESKEMPVYALVVAKGGAKLQPADIDEKDCPEASLAALGPQTPSTPTPEVCHAFNGGMGRGLHARAATLSDLAAFVESWTDRPLLDKTGIQGLYRFETKGWLPMDAKVAPDAPGTPLRDGVADADRPTLFEIFDQLGLKMESQKGVVDVYVIDHIEKPLTN